VLIKGHAPLENCTLPNRRPEVGRCTAKFWTLAYITFQRHKSILHESWPAPAAPKTIGEIIDHIERIREELLVLQRRMEKMESVNPNGTLKRISK
jgi:hypothetical protein